MVKPIDNIEVTVPINQITGISQTDRTISILVPRDLIVMLTQEGTVQHGN